MKCSLCGNSFTDGVQCSSCKRHLDFGCSQITEVGWKKLGSDRRAVWKCTACRAPSPIPQALHSGNDDVTLDVVLSEIRALKLQLASLPALIADVKDIKTEISDLKVSVEFNNSQITDVIGRVLELEGRVSDLEHYGERLTSMEGEVALQKSQISINEQRSRLNNIEIKGVPLKKDENLFNIVETICHTVNHKFPRSGINYIYRVPLHNSKDKTIIVSFVNRYMKEDFIAAARSNKTLKATDIGCRDAQQRIFINDHLTAESKNLLTRTKSLAKDRGYSYTWVKFGKIHVRKNDTSKVLIITKISDLNKML